MIDGSTISGSCDGSQGTYYRAFKTITSKHLDASAAITIKNVNNRNTASNSANCAMGFVFGLEEGEKVTAATTAGGEVQSIQLYTFGIASVRYNAKDSTAEWYVSWVNNCPSSVFGYADSADFSDKLYVSGAASATDYGKEEQIVPTSDIWAPVSGLSPASGTLSCTIKTTAKDDGSYFVALCDAAGDTQLATATIPANTTGLSKATQKYLGRYVVIYSGESAEGSIEITDVTKGALVEE